MEGPPMKPIHGRCDSSGFFLVDAEEPEGSHAEGVISASSAGGSSNDGGETAAAAPIASKQREKAMKKLPVPTALATEVQLKSASDLAGLFAGEIEGAPLCLVVTAVPKRHAL
jgi:hypothetical protein